MTTHVESGQTMRATGWRYPLPTQSIAHVRQHEGSMYHAGVRDEVLGDDANLDILFINNSVHSHACESMACGGDSFVDVYEDPFTDVNSLGTGMVARNRNRTFPDNTVQSSLYSNPFTDVNSLGTPLEYGGVIIGGSGGNSTGGGSGNDFFEWEFETGRSYLIRLTNKSGGAKLSSNQLNWYQKDDV